jgi:raffinose/stachyose/melibiose transport system permease protein
MRLSLEKRNQLEYYLFLAPGVTVFLLLIIAPFIANLVISLTKWSGIGKPVFIGFANYSAAIKDAAFWASFQNNLLLIIAMTVIPTIVGMLLAVFLFDVVARQLGQTTASFFRAGFYLPQVITVAVAAFAWKWLFQPNAGAANWVLKEVGLTPLNWLGEPVLARISIMIMMIWRQIGYPLVIFMAALQRIDPQLYESAAIDGANWWNSFTRITIPQIMAEIYVVVLTTVIDALKIFAPVYAMTSGGPGFSTSVAGYFSFKNFFERAKVGYGSAVATILGLIIVMVTVIFLTMQAKRERAA